MMSRCENREMVTLSVGVQHLLSLIFTLSLLHQEFHKHFMATTQIYQHSSFGHPFESVLSWSTSLIEKLFTLLASKNTLEKNILLDFSNPFLTFLVKVTKSCMFFKTDFPQCYLPVLRLDLCFQRHPQPIYNYFLILLRK